MYYYMTTAPSVDFGTAYSAMVRKHERATRDGRLDVLLGVVHESLDAHAAGGARPTFGHLAERTLHSLEESLGSVVKAIRSFVPVAEFVFSGSLAKGTYVWGISDIDVLCICADWEQAAPSEAVSVLAACVQDRLSMTRHATHVAVEVFDGVHVDVLPAFLDGTALCISRGDGSEWKPIHPGLFAQQLVKTDLLARGCLRPAIRLAKLFYRHPTVDIRLCGHHIEVMALECIERAHRPVTVAGLLREVVSRAPSMAKHPMPDSSGQRACVDEYLGPEKCARRLELIERMAEAAGRLERLLDGKDAAT